MRRRGAVLALAVLVAVGAAPLVAGAAAPAAVRRGTDQPADPVLATRAADLRRLAAPLPLPTERAPRVLFAGDSVAYSFADALAIEALRRGIGVARIVRAGCGILPGLPTTREGVTPPWTSACARAVGDWRNQIAATPADLVVFLSTWDGSPRLLDGGFVDPATMTGHTTIASLMRDLVDAVAPPGTGRGMVLLAAAPPTRGSRTGEPTAERVAEARQHRAVLRTVARSDPGRIRVVDLEHWLCPAGPPCPEMVDGVVARPEDGGHFSPEGAAWLAPRLLDALGLTPR